MFPLEYIGRRSGFYVSAIFLIGVILMVMPGAHGEEKTPEAGKRGRTAISDIPWSPGVIANDGKIIYGMDDRLDIYQETDPDRRAWAASVCALIAESNITDNGDGTFTLSPGAFTFWGYAPCEEEPYANQPSAAYCSGFIVAEDLIATAGHCIWQDDLPSMYFVFGFEMLDAATPVLTYNADQIYRGVAILARQMSQGNDFALVQVDRPIAVAGPLPLRQDGDITVGESVGIIGHPAGLPKKIAFGDATRVQANNDTRFFAANLDSYGGNSGSPVFNAATGLVEGILVRGNADFIFTSDCFRSNVFPDEAVYSEEISKSATFVDWVHGNMHAPANNLLEQATALVVDQAVTGSTVGASGDSESGCSLNDYADVWFTFTPDETGYYEISLCGSGFDTTLAVYSSANEELGCNDDWRWCSQASLLCLFMEVGQTYFIRVAGYAESTGDYVMAITKTDACETFEEEHGGCCRNGISRAFSSELLLLALSVAALLAFSQRTL